MTIHHKLCYMLNSIIFIYISHRGKCTKSKPSQTFGAAAALKNSVKSTTWLCERCDRRAEHNWLWVPANFFQCVQLRLRPTVEFSEWVNRYKNCIQYYVVLVCQLMECNVFTVCWTSHITEIKNAQIAQFRMRCTQLTECMIRLTGRNARTPWH